MPEYALKVQNLSKSFKDFKINNISFEVPLGTILGYVGQNGAGKTTTIKLIMNLLKKENGEVFIGNISSSKSPAAFLDKLGYIADDCYFPLSFTTDDIKSVLKSFYKSFNVQKFDKYLTEWELPRKKKVKEFSKGMKVKLMFAAVFSRDTELLILDEPTSGLDPVVRVEILDLLKDYVSNGKKSVLFSTHITSDLEKIADHICFIDSGELIYNDSKQRILSKFHVVKGIRADLSPEQKELVIGYKIDDPTFEGLIKTSDKGSFSKDSFKCVPATIEDIVVYTIKARQRRKAAERDYSSYNK